MFKALRVPLRKLLPARFLWAVMAAAVIIALVAVPAIAGGQSPKQGKAHEGAHPSCHGLANAYSHVLANAANDTEAQSSKKDLRAVADKHGCDLSGVEPATHPQHEDGNAENENEPSDDEGAGPPAEVIAAKCDRIAEKLAVAQARTQGHSAEAFANQADLWSCPTN
jgi:hypothetical protein